MVYSQIDRLNFRFLATLMTRPPLFERSEAAFWDDVYISSQMLQAHLDPSHDAASRKPVTIDRTVAWIMAHLGIRPGMCLLDLGCGPGLYCRRFAELGLQVTGIDYSRRSIAYAAADAAKHDLPITYHCRNYLEIDELEAYDIISLIYYDFGTLTDAERRCLLPRIHRALKPGGRFVFDVLTSAFFASQQEERTWNMAQDGGFWHDGSYFELKETLRYPEAETTLRQYVIVAASDEIRTYRIWESCFSTKTISSLLVHHGFIQTSFWSDLTGSPWNDSSAGMGIIARKEEL